MLLYRSDHMIYDKISVLFSINMLLNAIWLPLFQVNTGWGFIVSWLVMLCLLVTAYMMMAIADREAIWWPEILLVRAPFSIYAGWLTGATLLNTSYMLKSFGMADDDFNRKGVDIQDWGKWMLFGYTEQHYAAVALTVAFIVVTVTSWVERNPLYGAVGIWALTAISQEQEARGNTISWMWASLYDLLNILSQGSLIFYLVYEEFQTNFQRWTYWKGGIMSNVDYALMF